MSWHFSRALEVAFSAENSKGGEQSVRSKKTHTPGTFWSPGKMTDASIRSRSGMMFAPSTESHGVELLMWCLEDSRARIFQRQERAQESTERDLDCGAKWPASLARFDPITCSWKTHQCLLFEDSQESLETLPRWGMTVAGELWALSTPAPLTKGTGSGLWPTPTANEDSYRLRGNSQQSKSLGALMRKEAMFPTARATDGSKGSRTAQGAAKELARGKSKDLGTIVAMWPTPHGFSPTGKSNGPSGNELGRAVNQSLFPTPTVQDAKNNGTKSQMIRNTKPLNAVVGGSLNPTWVEWLMGWPLGWTDCAASATDRCLLWWLLHGKY